MEFFALGVRLSFFTKFFRVDPYFMEVIRLGECNFQ